MTDSYNRAGNRPAVSLVCMPYAAIEHPSVGLGLLKARLLGAGIATETHYVNLSFAQQIGIHTYTFVSERSCTDFLGDWTFSRSAFPEHRANDAEYLSRLSTIFRYRDPRRLRLVAWQMRDATQSFVNRTADQILARSPLIVGCTSTFQQHVASLALLRKIKELDENIVTMIGGANCEGKMGEETHRSFPWVDFVVSGEADDLIIPLCQAILDHGKDLTANQMPNGVLGPAQKTQGRCEIGRQVVKDLDNLPIPDYDDYFRTVEETGLTSQFDPGLLVESSRGCWWGEKNHCTFCGLNGFGMLYRSKSSERLINEMNYLSHRYKTNKFAFVDNILDMKYFKDTLPELAKRKEKFNIMFETKANLKQGQVHQLAEAGVFYIQPGIETMHSVLSKKLDKGNTPWINIQLLKWTLEQGIYVSWNFLYGLPGEEDVWYREMTKWMPQIIHLQPPSGLSPIRFDRFSPYHDKQSEFGLQLDPVWSYMYNYPLPEERLQSLAYYFSDTAHALEIRKRCPSIFLLEEQINEWNVQYYGGDTPDGREDYAGRPVLFQTPNEGGFKITDTRPCAAGKDHQISGLPAQVLTFCNEARNPQKVAEEFKKFGPASISAALDELIDKKFLLLVENRLIGLPVSTPQRPMVSLKNFPAGYIHPAKTGLQDPWSTPLTSILR